MLTMLFHLGRILCVDNRQAKLTPSVAAPLWVCQLWAMPMAIAARKPDNKGLPLDSA